jgi:hypothetical protein
VSYCERETINRGDMKAKAPNENLLAILLASGAKIE